MKFNQQLWSKDNAEHLRAYRKVYWKIHAKEKLIYMRMRSKQGRVKFMDLKSRTKRKGMPFNLSLKTYTNLIEKPCFYCGGDLPAVGHGLDRIDSRKGYTSTNVRPCCKVCNSAKNNLTEVEFSRWIKRIYRHWAKSFGGK